MRRSQPCPDCLARTDEVLRGLTTRSGVTAAEWLWAPAGGEPTHVLLASGPEMTVHGSTTHPARTVYGDAAALPLRSRSVGALLVSSVLPVLPDLNGLFAEFRRVLRPHGLLGLLVPVGPPLGLRARRVRARVRDGWEHRSAVDHPDWLATAADFAVLGDDRLPFRSRDRDRPAELVERLCSAGLLPPRLPGSVRQALAEQSAVKAGRVTLRRVVARR